MRVCTTAWLLLVWPASAVSSPQAGAESTVLPVDKLGAVEIESRFTLQHATQVMNFVAAKHAVFASLRRSANQRPVLVAWKPDGALLWSSEQPEAYQLAVTRDHVVLAYDAGTLRAERGLIWVDAESGREVMRRLLPGRPMRMSVLQETGQLLVFVMSAGRLEALSDRDDCWLGVLAFDLQGKPAWEWKEQCFELAPLRVDVDTLVVATRKGSIGAVTGLSPASGKERWRTKWDVGATSEAPIPALPSHRSLCLVPGEKEIQFLDAATGELKGAFPLPLQGRRGVWTTAHDDRLFVTSDALDGITIAAYGMPPGKALWSDKTGTVSYAGPVAWGAEIVLLARRSTGGLTGNTSLTELRLYSAEGELVGHLPTVALKKGSLYWETSQLPQLVYGRLYVAGDDSVVALRRK